MSWTSGSNNNPVSAPNLVSKKTIDKKSSTIYIWNFSFCPRNLLSLVQVLTGYIMVMLALSYWVIHTIYMPEIEALGKHSARICVPNENIEITDPQERVDFSSGVTVAALEEGRFICAHLGSVTCKLGYEDITALASELEEIGYVSCGGELAWCRTVVNDTAVAITEGLQRK